MNNNTINNCLDSSDRRRKRSGQTVAPQLFCKTVLGLLAALFLFSPAEAAPEKIVLTATDGYQITGTLMKGDTRAGVVLLHMYRHDRASWQPLIEKLSGRGITSLAIDMRGHPFDPSAGTAPAITRCDERLVRVRRDTLSEENFME